MEMLSPCALWKVTNHAAVDAGANMQQRRQLVPQAVLFGKAIAYACTACGKKFSVSLLNGAVRSDAPPPASVFNAFLDHVCEGKTR